MTKAIHENSVESHIDHEEAGKGNTYRHQIINLLTYTQQHMTDRQIIDRLHVTDVNNIRPEITRLKQLGVISEVGKTKCPITGKTVRLVAIVPKGQGRLF